MRAAPQAHERMRADSPVAGPLKEPVTNSQSFSQVQVVPSPPTATSPAFSDYNIRTEGSDRARTSLNNPTCLNITEPRKSSRAIHPNNTDPEMFEGVGTAISVYGALRANALDRARHDARFRRRWRLLQRGSKARGVVSRGDETLAYEKASRGAYTKVRGVYWMALSADVDGSVVREEMEEMEEMEGRRKRAQEASAIGDCRFPDRRGINGG